MFIICSATTGIFHAVDDELIVGSKGVLTLCGRSTLRMNYVCCYSFAAAKEMFFGHADTCGTCLKVMERMSAKDSAKGGAK